MDAHDIAFAFYAGYALPMRAAEKLEVAILDQERAILEEAADRVCNACHATGDCVEKCGTIKAILEPITKEKS